MPKIAPNIQQVEEPIFSVEAQLVSATVNNRKSYLATLAALAIGCPFIAAWVPMPMNFRAILIVSGVISAGSFVTVEETTRSANRYGSIFNKAQEAQVKTRLKTQLFTESLLQQYRQTNVLLEQVDLMPEEMREYWLEQWRLKGVVRQARAALPASAATVTVENKLSPGVQNQPTLSAELEAELEQKLDTTWFAEWTARSGAVCGETGDGKCLGKGTPIVMADLTVKNIEDVVVGDLVMGDDSKPRKVLSLARGKEEMFRITPISGADPFECNRSHILSFVSGYGKAGWEIGKKYDISIDDYLKLSKTVQRFLYSYRVAVDYPEQPVKIDPYYLGIWLGDGTAIYPCSVTKPDPEIRDFMSQMADQWGLEMRTRIDPVTGCPTYRICSNDGAGIGSNRTGIVNPLMDTMRSYGLSVDGAKFIPQEYLSNSIEVRLQLLAGIIDTDGYLFNGSCYDIAQKDHALAAQIVYLARSVGMRVSYNVDKIVNGVTYKRFTICGNTEIIPVKIARRKASARTSLKDPMRTGITVKSLGNGDYYGFTIDGNHRFLLGDFTVTHNTFLLKYVQLDFMSRNPLGTIIIIDLDFGSSHGDEPGNLWANAEEGKVVFTDIESAFYAIKRVSDEVDKRAKLTIIEQKKGNPKPKFDPWLLIIDEGLLVWAKLDNKQRELYLDYISNILTRGLKQGNITFKFGAQSLAVGKIGLDQMILNSIEIVLLYRAAQTKINYRNIRDGGDEAELDTIITTVKRFPEKIGRLRLAVGYTGKQFQMIGVPHITFTEPTITQTNNDEYAKSLWDTEYQDKYGDDIDVDILIDEDTLKDTDNPPGDTKTGKVDYLKIHETIMNELVNYDGVLTDEIIKGVYEKITGQSNITKELIKYIRDSIQGGG